MPNPSDGRSGEGASRGTASRAKGARDVFAGLARGFGGSILFALPLLMTMEMWWLGSYLGATRILLLMAVLFPILVGVAYYIGLGDTASVGHAAFTRSARTASPSCRVA